MNNLFNLTVTDFLDEMGSGKSVPGSGCGCAFHSLISAKMTITHIRLTAKMGSETFNQNDFKKLHNEIDLEVASLIDSFNKDYDLFQEYRHLCREIIKTNGKIVYQLERKRDLILIDATKTLLEIARASLRLAELAIAVFDKGYEAAKGESGLSMINLLGVVDGCFLIAYQNLGELTKVKTVKSILEELEFLNNESDRLQLKVEKRKKETMRKNMLRLEINTLLAQTKSMSYLNYENIEIISRKLQSLVWKHYVSTNKDSNLKSPLEIFDPEEILNLVGYKVFMQESLGEHVDVNGVFETAGLLDTSKKFVAVSKKFGPEVRRFTLAHELGHILLNHSSDDLQQLHRDRPISKWANSSRLNKMEKQANKFAANLLMPKKIVLAVFEQYFGTSKFMITEASSFAMNRENTSVFKAECKDSFGLALILAKCEYYDGKAFYSMANYFKVSEITMAYRLDELNLVEFNKS